ncbi:MAG: hypothetical protein V1820_04330 [archaeon]
MAIGITPELEDGTCSICKRKAQVRFVIDSEKGLAAGICLECALPSKLTAEEILVKYGKESAKAKKAFILEKDEWVKEQQNSQPPAFPPKLPQSPS